MASRISVSTVTLTHKDHGSHFWQSRQVLRHWRVLLSCFWVGMSAIAAGMSPPLIQSLERQTQTLFWELRGAVIPPQDVVILAIDEESLSQGQHYLDQPDRYAQLAEIRAWPWQRSAYATVIQKLLDSGAKAVALDVVFSTPSTYGSADDEALAQVLAEKGDQVVLAAQYGDLDIRQGLLLQPTLPLQIFQETPVKIGAINFIIEPDGKIHQLSQKFLSQLLTLESAVDSPPEDWFTADPIVSFAEATLQAAGVSYDPVKGDNIFFYGPTKTFPHIPFWYVLDSDPWQSQLGSGAIFKDKIVLIGSTATLHQDFHAAPFSKSFLYPAPLSGVEILANTVATLQSGRALRTLTEQPGHNALIVAALGMSAAALMHQVSVKKPLMRLLLAVSGALVWAGISYGLFVRNHLIVMTATPILGIVTLAVFDFTAGSLGEQFKKKQLRNTLARYVTSPIVQEIISEQDDFRDLLATRVSDISGKILSDRYRILSILGSGGFGETYLAEDTQRPGNPICVVKQLKIISDNPNAHRLAQRLFSSEAATLEKLGEHDQIPRLLAYFEFNYSFYLVQERVEGKLLREMLVNCKPMSQRAVVELLLDLLPVIQFVHTQGVIHRDIKPSNIIYRDHDHRYVLIDFGAVKQISNQLTDTNAQITSTVGIGTQGYMPSEQSAGLPGFNSDLYALGVTAIEALTGLPPHTLQRSATGELLWIHKVENLIPSLAAVLQKMVRYDFSQRYGSAQQALDDLKQISLAALPSVTAYSGNSSFTGRDAASNRTPGIIDIDSSLGDTELLPPDWESNYPTIPEEPLEQPEEPIEPDPEN